MIAKKEKFKVNIALTRFISLRVCYRLLDLVLIKINRFVPGPLGQAFPSFLEIATSCLFDSLTSSSIPSNQIKHALFIQCLISGNLNVAVQKICRLLQYPFTNGCYYHRLRIVALRNIQRK